MPIIAIKVSQGNNTPSSLANGELAYSFSSDKLFIGQTSNSSVATTVEYIGGKLSMDKIANLESIVAGAGPITGSTLTSTGRLTLTTHTNNAVLFAKTGGVVDFVTGTTGKVLQIAANGTPFFDDLNGGTY